MSVEFLFDYASPWSFLADAILPRSLPGIAVRKRPVYLRGFSSFAQGMPYGPEKLAYQGRDFLRCVAHEGVTVAMPSNFPINGVHLLRGALAAEREGVFDRFHEAAFRATWQESKDVSDKAVAAAIAREISPAVAEGMEDPAIKERLRADTADAVARGAFGVPSFFVGEELFWGHDRLPYVARAITPTR